MPRPYRPLPESIPELEEEVLACWEREDTLARSLEIRRGAPEFVFYEGPPTANGRPGVHHILSRTIKDCVARFRTMSGQHVTRKAGWDTHGLPVEIEAEKKLQVSGKAGIERVGIGRFNQVCRDSLFTYKADWERLSRRIGYWLDYKNAYVTCTPEYVESVWWALAEIDRKGWLYRGYKVVPYCPRCGTGLSSHEVALGYADRTDPSLFVRFPIEGSADTSLLVWTTTPWTLISNVGVAFSPKLEYVEVEEGDGRLILSRSRAEALFGDRLQVVRRIATEELNGLEYRRPLDAIPDYPVSTGRLWPADFVSDEEGTGLVHVAPAFGAEDYQLGRTFDLPVVRPVDESARFDPAVRLVGGDFVRDADPAIIEELRSRGLVYRSAEVVHSYPHCWRCDSPLVYMVRDSWYVQTTAVRDRLLEHNAGTLWQPPEIGAGRMGEWLKNNVDWAISRDRYWGTPLPIWECDRDPAHREVIGSYADLRQRMADLPLDFDPHRPAIDEIGWACTAEGCGGVMSRVPEVLDAWFDSGSMPFAQWHYPFENKDEFERHFPADFIAEGVDQTRGWFYSLVALSTLLFDSPAYRAVVVNDLVLDESGQKMSKSRGNVIDPWETIGEHGADAIRFHLLAGSNPWLPKRWDSEALRETNRKVFATLRNTYRFFSLYANLEGWSHVRDHAAPVERRPVMDRWLLGRLDTLAGEVSDALSAYDLTGAARALSDFVQNDLSNWYVRRTRDRFWASRPGQRESAHTEEAFSTLHEALVTSAALLAPFAPFLSDWLYRELCGGESVHLSDFPAALGRENEELARGMADVRELVSLGRAAREQLGLRVRQPLRSLKAFLPGGRRLASPLADLLSEELNVKAVVFPSESSQIIQLFVKPDFARLGPRFGARTPAIVRAIGGLGQEEIARLRDGESVVVSVHGGEEILTSDEVHVVEESRGELVVQSGRGYVVALDGDLDDALRAEGVARELVNRIQHLRRDAGLAVSDRIALGVAGAEPLVEAVAAHRDYIATETLAVSLDVGVSLGEAYEHVREVEIEAEPTRIGLRSITGSGTRG